ncbi:peptidoglycan-binding domain-containing protein, partial [Albidovulum sp.]|uniref:peptidoglycan-binding domain-containing protein n=1 Tax=Albidovulum sp. TaxID=1872424 RepID=UPI0039B87CCC
ERRRIQARLADAGYYRGGIDGAFGPMTYQAIMAIAGDSTGTGQLGSMAGAHEFYDTILG